MAVKKVCDYTLTEFVLGPNYRMTGVQYMDEAGAVQTFLGTVDMNDVTAMTAFFADKLFGKFKYSISSSQVTLTLHGSPYHLLSLGFIYDDPTFGTLSEVYYFTESRCRYMHDPNVVRGCTDEDASNYDSTAAEENDTCVFPAESKHDKFLRMYANFAQSKHRNWVRGQKDCCCEMDKEQFFSQVVKISQRVLNSDVELAPEVSATVELDFSTFEFITLVNGMSIDISIHFSDNTDLLLTTMNGDFLGITPEAFLTQMVASINVSNPDFVTTYSGSGYLVSITAAPGYGASINQGIVGMTFPPFYSIFDTHTDGALGFYLKDVINNPLSPGYGYTIAMNFSSTGSYGATLLFHHNTKPTVTYLIPASGLTAINTPISVVYNPITDRIYVAQKDTLNQTRLYILHFDGAAVTTVDLGIYATYNLTTLNTKPLFNPVDNSVYFASYSFGGVNKHGFIKIAPDSITVPTISFLISGDTAIDRPVMNTVTGAIAYMTNGDQFEELSNTGTVNVLIPTGTLLSCKGISFFNQSGVWKYLFFYIPSGGDLALQEINSDYSLGTAYDFDTVYNGGDQPFAEYLNDLNLIYLKSGTNPNFSVRIYDFSASLGTTLAEVASFPMTTTNATPFALYQEEFDCMVWGNTGTVGPDLTYMKYVNDSIYSNIGIFDDGLDAIVETAEDECISFEENETLLENATQLIINCNNNV